MIVLDANLLLYAYDHNSTFHLKARPWLEETFSGPELVGLPWLTIAAFMRIATNPRLRGNRYSMNEAISLVEFWSKQPNVRVLWGSERTWPVLTKMLIDGQVTGSMVTDAELAALTVEYGGVLHTVDRDFARFPGLRWRNPLA